MSHLTLIVTNWLSGFEISLVRMPYKTSQNSYDVCLVARGFQMQAVRCSLDDTCTWLQLGAEFCPLPSQTRFPKTKNFRIQSLWQCLSMPGKPRPLEALNSIVSASPRDRHQNKSCMNHDWVRVHCTVTGGGCQAWAPASSGMTNRKLGAYNIFIRFLKIIALKLYKII